MSFCAQCGKVLSSSVEALRQARGVKKRSCSSCGRSDELNNRYCVFCGSDIEIFQTRKTSAEALAKFNDDLNSLSTPSSPSSLASAVSPRQSQVALPALPVPAKATPRPDLFIILGLVSGLAMPFLLGSTLLSHVYLTSQIPSQGLLIFSDKANAGVLLESIDRKEYVAGQTSKRGVFYSTNLSLPAYRLRLSAPGCRTLLQKIELAKDRLNCLGLDKPISLPLLPGIPGGK
ncbi:MAG: hypothetical protein K2Y32_21110 [Candidatus Obscuribacterales bacterium]|nr:hypothetical protein [Candidatus Obscuribacterales bacterium]